MRLTVNSVGKYELRAVLARTPLGTVYDGWDSDIARRVAVKMIPLSANEDTDATEALIRFKRGAQAAGKLNHPNIVAVYDYGEADGYAYLVMEFIDGPTLKRRFDDNQRFALSDIHTIIGGILEALQYSHDHGVVHRDIKPANIMFTRNNLVKITDFGIARIEDSEMTQAGMVIGTPAYMSPEQFLGEKIDARTDIYSTGVVLYQILTGERPYEGNLATIMHKVLYDPPPVPSRISTMVTPALDRAVTRAMARNREERFGSAAEFIAALQATLAPAAPRIERSPRLPATPVKPSRLAESPRRPPSKPAVAAKPRAMVFALIAAIVVAMGGVATWYASNGSKFTSHAVTSSQGIQPATTPPTAPASDAAKASPGAQHGDSAAVIAPSEVTNPAAPVSRPDPVFAEQQDRTKTSVSNFDQPKEALNPLDLGQASLLPPEIAPRLPAAGGPAPTGGSQRDSTSSLVSKKPVNRNQPDPFSVGPDRRLPNSEAKAGKPAPENPDRFASLTDSRFPQNSDSIEAVLRRLHTERSIQQNPATQTAPSYPTTSSSAVGLLCQSVTAETAGSFGLDSPQGMIVTGVAVGSAAAKAGIRQDDVILKIKGKEASNLSVLAQVAGETGAGQTVPIEILRHRIHQTLHVHVDQLQR